MATQFKPGITSEQLAQQEKELRELVRQYQAQQSNASRLTGARNEGPISEQQVRDAKIRYRQAQQNYKEGIRQEGQNERIATQFQSAVDLKNTLDENITKAELVNPDYQYVQPNRTAAAEAYRQALASRNQLAASAANFAPYATGEQSYARTQGQLDFNRNRAALMSQLAGQRGGGVAALRATQRAIGDSGGQILDQARAQGIQERLSSAQALSQLLAGLNQTDLNMQSTANRQQFAEAALAQTLADYKYNQQLDLQDRDMALFNTILGRQDADTSVQAARARDRANARNAMWSNITGLVGAAGGVAAKAAGG